MAAVHVLKTVSLCSEIKQDFGPDRPEETVGSKPERGYITHGLESGGNSLIGL